MTAPVTIVPANEASWDDLETVHLQELVFELFEECRRELLEVVRP